MKAMKPIPVPTSTDRSSYPLRPDLSVYTGWRGWIFRVYRKDRTHVLLSAQKEMYFVQKVYTVSEWKTRQDRVVKDFYRLCDEPTQIYKWNHFYALKHGLERPETHRLGSSA